MVTDAGIGVPRRRERRERDLVDSSVSVVSETSSGSEPTKPSGSEPTKPSGSEPETQRGSEPTKPSGSEPETQRGSEPETQRGSEPETQRGSEPATWSVREVCDTIEQVFADRFTDEIWVQGAISGLNRSGEHVYFDLVEPGELGNRPDAMLPVALFASSKFRVNAILKRAGSVRMVDGIEIRIRGRLTYYGRQSRVQLVMSLIDPAFTLGRLEIARTRLLAALAAEGVLDANRRLARPLLPLRLVLITSVSSAAEADFVNELQLSGLPFDLTVIDSRVQGDEAVGMLVSAVAEAIDHRPDLIAIVRGGGARTDLMAFDHEDLARAIVASPVPVFVGIGHEIDQSVADIVAHHSVKTPTACAAAIVELVRDFARRVDHAEDRLDAVVHTTLDRADRRLDEAASRIGRLASAGVEREWTRLALLAHRRTESIDRRFERLEAQLDRNALRTSALDPARTLARGWSITRRGDGSLVREPSDAPDGTLLVTTLATGTITSRSGGADD